MKNILHKFRKIERDLSQTFGDFTLFALFLREDSPGKWDVVVSSPTIQEIKSEFIGIISEKIKSEFTLEERLKLSRVIIVDQDNPKLHSIQDEFTIEHGIVEFHNHTFFNLNIDHALFMTVRKSLAEAE